MEHDLVKAKVRREQGTETLPGIEKEKAGLSRHWEDSGFEMEMGRIKPNRKKLVR